MLESDTAHCKLNLRLFILCRWKAYTIHQYDAAEQRQYVPGPTVPPSVRLLRQLPDGPPCKVWSPHMITNTIYCYTAPPMGASFDLYPPAVLLPCPCQLLRRSWFLIKSVLPSLQLEYSLIQRCSVTTLTTSLSWSSLPHIARANGPSKAWLFYEFRTPYLILLTLQHVKMKSKPWILWLTWFTYIDIAIA